MEKKQATYAIVLFTKQPKKDGTFPLKLRITYDRKQMYYGIGWSFDEPTWEKIKNQNARGEYRDTKLRLAEIENKAKKVIDDQTNNGQGFSFQKFEEVFFNQNNDTDDIFMALVENANELKAVGKINSSIAVTAAQKSFEAFFGKKQLRFSDVTPATLLKYERWMIEQQHNSVSTVGIYLRSLRAIFNRQIAKGLIEHEKYPFGRYKYQIPAVELREKTISNKMLQLLYEFKPVEFSGEDKAKDLWFFLYLSNGMNVKDMCRLKYSNFNFKEGYFVFSRAKTESISKQKRKISVIINEEIMKIISKWGNRHSDTDCNVFPFYTSNITPENEKRITQNLTSVINDNMNRIAKKLGLDINITTYSARQTFSNVLLNSDAPIKLISDSLGHSNTAVTEKHYLKKVSIEKQKLFNGELLKFDKQ